MLLAALASAGEPLKVSVPSSRSEPGGSVGRVRVNLTARVWPGLRLTFPVAEPMAVSALSSVWSADWKRLRVTLPLAVELAGCAAAHATHRHSGPRSANR